MITIRFVIPMCVATLPSQGPGLPLRSIDRSVRRRCRLAGRASLLPFVPMRLRRARGLSARQRGSGPAVWRRSGARPLLRDCCLAGGICYPIHNDREILSDSWRPFAERVNVHMQRSLASEWRTIALREGVEPEAVEARVDVVPVTVTASRCAVEDAGQSLKEKS